MDAGLEVSGAGLVRNDLVVSRLTRDWHDDTLSCTATNSQRLSPVTVSATILMHREYTLFEFSSSHILHVFTFSDTVGGIFKHPKDGHWERYYAFGSVVSEDLPSSHIGFRTDDLAYGSL